MSRRAAMHDRPAAGRELSCSSAHGPWCQGWRRCVFSGAWWPARPAREASGLHAHRSACEQRSAKLQQKVAKRCQDPSDRADSAAGRAAPANDRTHAALVGLLQHVLHDECHLLHACVHSFCWIVRRQLEYNEHNSEEDEHGHMHSGDAGEHGAKLHGRPNGQQRRPQHHGPQHGSKRHAAKQVQGRSVKMNKG